MIVLGLILLLVWYLTAIALLKILGLIVLFVGVILLALGMGGVPVGPRRYYW